MIANRRGSLVVVATLRFIWATTGLTSLATDAGAADDPAPQPLGEPGCFESRDVVDFRVLDQSRVIVLAPNDKHAFLVRITPPSPGLRSADSIGFETRNGRICGHAGERLHFHSAPAIGYLLADVRRLDGAEVDVLRAEADARILVEPSTEITAVFETLEDANETDDTANEKETLDP
ncbi:MAG: DUF6491 family protein [Gammaproteobacteria bacterium]|nr:DUF6491 family protein [Gammaproteobacteria bacterium]